jgi:hypothetical protein
MTRNIDSIVSVNCESLIHIIYCVNDDVANEVMSASIVLCIPFAVLCRVLFT